MNDSVIPASRERAMSESLAKIGRKQVADMPRQAPVTVMPAPNVQMNMDMAPVAKALDRMTDAFLAQGELLAKLMELMVSVQAPEPPVVNVQVQPTPVEVNVSPTPVEVSVEAPVVNVEAPVVNNVVEVSPTPVTVPEAQVTVQAPVTVQVPKPAPREKRSWRIKHEDGTVSEIEENLPEAS